MKIVISALKIDPINLTVYHLKNEVIIKIDHWIDFNDFLLGSTGRHSSHLHLAIEPTETDGLIIG